MKNNFSRILMVGLLALYAVTANAWVGMSMPRLHVDGRYLKDTQGNIVNLHGFAQTYSPFFNEGGKYWDNYNVQGCLNYNQRMIDGILNAGWKVNFIRLHMDPYWSNTPGCNGRYEGEDCFNETRFKKYLDEVFVPMAEYAVSKGIYVIMRPPGVCSEQIAVGDNYNEYLIKVWNIVSQHPSLKNHPNIMFELANEPINILGPDGDYGATSQGHFDKLKEYFQSVVDVIRANCDNILWVPGLGYQSLYKGYALNPIEGKNIGYAVHIYPGWFGSANGYESFQREWDINVKPVADFAPIVVTEMDWAPEKYEASWGKGVTGTAGGEGFGANFKKITDESGNVSWLIFTEPYRLAQFTGIPPANGESYTFLNDPEACPLPTYNWYQEYAQVNYPRPEYAKQSHSDNGDGTFINPVIHAEFPDPDVIKVGDVYYMVSTTMHIFPGATLLKSYDLVNWEFCSNPLEMIESSDCYNMDSNCPGNTFRYARGQWATSIRYNNGKFYLLFCTLDEGGYVLTATDPEGIWSLKKLSNGYYDPGLFFDDNGKIYIAHGINNIMMTEVDENFTPVKEQKVFERTFRDGLEGSHLYKINGYYYIYATYGGFPAFQVALRSQNIWGPYEEKKLFEDDNIHQGALVQTQTGEWWTIMFYDKMPYGRMPNLQPVTWENAWPVIGVNGKGVKRYTKPNVGRDYPVASLSTNDNFRDYKLGLQWGWNHNADASKWSLIERPGFLRLKTANVVDSLVKAKNTLTQRIFGYQSETIPSYATIKIHVKNMQEGDVAGLSTFTKPDTYIGVKMQDGVKKIFVETNNSTTWGPDITAVDTVVYFRAVTQYKSSAMNTGRFYYSTDNATYTPLASPFELKYTYDFFVAPRFAIFNFATQALGGYVDIDWFTTEEVFSEETFFDNSFTGYSEDQLTLERLQIDSESIQILLGTSKTLKITAVFKDGHIENITTKAQIDNSNPEIVKVVNGQIVALKEGETTLTATYQGSFGPPQSIQFKVYSKIFPLSNDAFNPSIFGTGSFDENTGKLITSQYGFGGWIYENGLDISSYNYLIVKLKSPTTSGASFRIFDENSYWTSCYMNDFRNNQTVAIIDLKNMKKEMEEGGVKIQVAVDPSHIYIVGFWSYGNAPIYIEDVSLSMTPTAIDSISLKKTDANEIVDVYSIMGVKLRSKVVRKEATNGLPTGFYIVGNQKVMVYTSK
jgi:beta-xylosidase